MQQCPKSKTHGNKLDSKTAEGYVLVNRNGRTVKIGETTRGEDKFGVGKQQRYPQRFLKENNLDYVKEASGTKIDMHKWQNQKIIEFTNIFGSRPLLNKSNY
ncbi:hypothetical protein [Acinetobacter sp.]|uniref:hypothetical protein n=1 Tax=Acinetobacter sp. TaxID=472 RepID=UPI00388F9340